MGKLIYSMNVSLDGFVETTGHSLEWGLIDEELHTWFNEEERNMDAELYGRRMYETMSAYWPTAESDPAATPATLDFARRNLIDEYHVVVHPVVLGAGTPFFPADSRVDLELLETRTFASGVVYLGYRPRSAAA